MTALRFHFPAGRWHATAWGSHVNEGVPDWPPAPWRICRALIATWFHKHRAVFPEEQMRSLIETLAGAAPSYALPAASSSHTRHYMPLASGARTKVFDTFVHVAPGEALTVLWPVDLGAPERELLVALLASMSYFGRAESLVEAALLPVGAKLPEKVDARPLTKEIPLREDEEPIRLLAPEIPAAHAEWLSRQAAPASAGRRGRRAAGPALPPSVFDALLADTGELKAAGWSQPPGSRWVDYARPAEPFRVAPQRVPRPDERRPKVARFAVVSDVPPRITEALSLGERFHRALVSRTGAPVFTGKQPDGAPAEGHAHAYYLSECEPRRGQVRFLTLYARMGFDAEARRALEGLRQTWGYDGHKLQLILLGTGEPTDFAGTSTDAGQSLALASAKDWVSLTPFVPTRHLKTHRNGTPKRDAAGLAIGSPEHDLRRLLREAGLPEPRQIAGLNHLALGSKRLRWLQFQRRRRHGDGARSGEHGHGFRVAFDEEVTGPIALGYGAHFGLGLFVPADAWLGA